MATQTEYIVQTAFGHDGVFYSRVNQHEIASLPAELIQELKDKEIILVRVTTSSDSAVTGGIRPIAAATAATPTSNIAGS